MFSKIHAVVIVENAGRNENTSISPTDFIYQMTQPITFHNRSKFKQYFARIENIRIPISFYNINSFFDRFDWESNSIAATGFTITHGNYTIDELIAEVQVQMNADSVDANVYTITYDEITQKVNIASDGTTGDFDTLTGDGWQALGFNLTESITGASNTDGTDIAYTNTTRHLRLLVDNMNSNNVYSNDDVTKQTNVQKIAVTIPITETRNEFQFFQNHDGYQIKMPNTPTINEFRVKLVDANNNTVDLQNVPFGFDIVFREINIPRI